MEGNKEGFIFASKFLDYNFKLLLNEQRASTLGMSRELNSKEENFLKKAQTHNETNTEAVCVRAVEVGWPV